MFISNVLSNCCDVVGSVAK